MDSQHTFVAGILQTSAAGYAGFAASLLLERHPELGERYAPRAGDAWRAHLSHWVQELAVALELGEPRLFSARVAWTRTAFRSRDVPATDVSNALNCLADVLTENLPPGTAETAQEYLSAAKEALAEADRADASSLDPDDPLGQLALRYVLAALEGDTQGAIDLVMAQVRDGLEVRRVLMELIPPALREIGRLWHVGKASVAEEHVVTATTQRLMAVLMHDVESAPANGHTVMVASVAGNAHDIGPRILAYLFELEGWRTLFLGADVPTNDLVASAQAYDADLVVVSASLGLQLGTLSNAVDALEGLGDSAPKVMVGGRAFDDLTEQRGVGADGYARDVAEAISLGARLLDD